jgi:hypothetical protein
MVFGMIWCGGIRLCDVGRGNVRWEELLQFSIVYSVVGVWGGRPTMCYVCGVKSLDVWRDWRYGGQPHLRTAPTHNAHSYYPQIINTDPSLAPNPLYPIQLYSKIAYVLNARVMVWSRDSGFDIVMWYSITLTHNYLQTTNHQLT